MKTKIVGILVIMLLIATVLPAVGLTNIKEIETINGSSLSKSNRQIKTIEKSFMGGSRGALFMQLPSTPTEEWNGLFSDSDREVREFDDFWEVSGPICDVHWWGFGVFWNGTHWLDCPPTDMIFEITFYHDDGTGKPGDVACNYNDITPTVVPTGIYYRMLGSTDWLQLYYFEVDLDPCCQLSDGWFSVFKTYNPSDCIFTWMTCPDGNWNMWRQNTTSGEWIWLNWDLSFILTDGEPDVADLECDGELSWTDISPGATVIGDFVVRNNGDPDSILHWKVEGYPNWGSDWTFTPNAGILTIGAGWLTVDVEVVAPDNPNEDFTGEIKLVNAADPSDTCSISVSLATPVNQQVDTHPLFQRIFERFPNAFPIMRHLMGI